MTPDEDGVTWKVYVDQRFASLKEHFDSLRDADQGAIEAALNAAKQAVTKAEAASEKRFEGVNEFRAQLDDQQRTLMPRSEAELRFKNAEDRLAALEHSGAERGGQRAGTSAGWGWAVAVVGLVGLVIAIATAVIALRR